MPAAQPGLIIPDHESIVHSVGQMSLAERLISHQTASGSGVVQHFRQPAILSARSSFPRGPLIHRSNSLVCCARVNGNSGHIAASQVATDIAQQQVQQTAQEEQHLHVKTRYIAETLLPTRHGKFRLRGYKHSVSCLRHAHQARCYDDHTPVCHSVITLMLSLPVCGRSWMVASHSLSQPQ